MKSMAKITYCMLVACVLAVPVFARGNKKTQKELSVLIWNEDLTGGMQSVFTAAEKKLGIKFDFDIQGEDRDLIVKTRLASGDIPDLVVYNTGSLLAPLNPQDYFIDLSHEPYASNIDPVFKKAASINGKLYAVPFGSEQAGAVVYNRKVYKKYGLSVPKTWKEFIHNCDILKKNGESALIGTFGAAKDIWTAQILFLGDNYNVCKGSPEFPEKFEKGTMKYATTPAALRSWQKLADTVPYYNSDYLACSTSDGYDLLATGKGAQWFMLTSFLLPQIASLYPENLDDLGVFGIPGDNPDDQGITLWIPNGLYGNKNSRKVALIKEFMKYFVSKDGLDAYCRGLGFVDGPLPADINYVPQQKTIPLVADINAYVRSGKTDTAMEFKTSVKGANAQSICCECLSGQTTAEEAAKIYDDDCRKQAVQLGLNWK